MSHILYLALGSNLGDREAHLRAAREALPSAVQLLAASPVYETEPWDYADQQDFLNQVVQARTDLAPRDLLRYLKDLELRLGRTPTFRNGPRVIDLDLLFYDDLVLSEPGLSLPHPGIPDRAFVLVPLADLAPDLRHPVRGQTVRQMLARVDRSGVHPYHSLLPWGTRTFVMGVLNVTPDSFSGDGLLRERAGDWRGALLEQASSFVTAGADILDVGGESTRPGSTPLSAKDELARVIPAIEAISMAHLGVLISVDTYKASVAAAALQAGASWINDVWGLRADPDMAPLAARSAAPLVVMHNRSKPANAEIQARLGGRYVGMQYADLIADVRRELMESVDLARAAGVSDDRIILDPGIGFGKTVEQNLELIRRLNEVRALGFPILLGPSRKGFIGYTLALPPEERLEGTAAAVALGIEHGADVIRAHDVQAMVRVARMTDALLGRPRPQPAPEQSEHR
ncbi:MAG TPA: dihydropteroate synthase [Anaerolineaceae bacterium]|nr:dihydropteroate synthase [Anaerolineaceae bacterium]